MAQIIGLQHLRNDMPVNVASNEVLKFMIQTHAEQIDSMREKMDEFKETMLATSHTLQHVKSAIDGFNKYLDRIEEDNKLRYQEIERRILELEDKSKFVSSLKSLISNKYVWILMVFLAFCIDKHDIYRWFSLLKGVA